MRSRRFLTAVFASAVLCAGAPARAADPGMPIAISNWTGGHVGLQAGFGVNAGEWREDGGLGTLQPFGVFGKPTANFGGFAGFDWQLGRGVLGFEFSAADLRAVVRYDEVTPKGNFLSDQLFTASMRLGVDTSPGTLLYARGGVGLVRAIAPKEAWGILSDTRSRYLMAVEAGGGIETALMPNVSVRFEGAYLRGLDSQSLGGAVTYRPDHLTGRVGIAYRPSPILAQFPVVGKRGLWTGIYAGVMAGGVASSTVNGFATGIGDLGPVSAIDAGFGLFAGATYQVLDRVVVGIEGEGTWAQTEWGFAGSPTNVKVAGSDMNFGASGRIGFLATDETMLYVKAGWTWLNVKPSEPYALPGQEAELLDSPMVGLGIETVLLPHIRGRVEATYAGQFGTMRFEEAGGTVYVRPEMLQVRAGLAVAY